MATASTSLARNSLEKFGKKLTALTNHDTLKRQSFTAVDLDAVKKNVKNNKNAFHDQIPNLSRKLLGKTPIGRYSQFASQIVPKTTFEKATDTAFLQIGKLAQRWAEYDLDNDARFDAHNLEDSERHALAKSIGHQNRALATMGGVTNFLGLTGILVDTVWLLTVSLRSIFQIAKIYDKPLSGKEGIAMAYEILAKTDLSKLQEKQTLLAGLGVFEAMADQGFNSYRLSQHDDTSDTDSQDATTDAPNDNDGESTTTLHSVLQTVEEVATSANINLQHFNFAFLHKILPLTAVGIGTAYNNVIINEVVQIANATFGPAPKDANIDTAGSHTDSSAQKG